MNDQPLRHPRKLKVVTIGGGISAMNLAYMIQHETFSGPGGKEAGEWKMDDLVEHCIYEKDEVLGGTWWANRYPGVACDVPAHIYTCESTAPVKLPCNYSICLSYDVGEWGSR